MDYHGRIMNIEQTPPAYINNHPTDSRHNAYSVGHRDARHAAAEIVCEADKALREKDAEIARLREALEWLLSTVDRQTWSMSRFHAAKDKARAALAQVAEVPE